MTYTTEDQLKDAQQDFDDARQRWEDAEATFQQAQEDYIRDKGNALGDMAKQLSRIRELRDTLAGAETAPTVDTSYAQEVA